MADKKAKERQLAEETIEAAGTAGETAAETAAEASEDVIQITQADLDNFKAKLGELSARFAAAQAEAAKEKARADDLNGMASRLQADFDNYRKRTNETNKRVREEGICAVLEKLLPLGDVIAQALTMISDEKVAEGVRMIARSLDGLLAGFGVEEIDALGQPFDPNLHNAVLRAEPDGETAADTVVEVFTKGYKLGDKVLRPAVVKVAG